MTTDNTPRKKKNNLGRWNANVVVSRELRFPLERANVAVNRELRFPGERCGPWKRNVIVEHFPQKNSNGKAMVTINATGKDVDRKRPSIFK